MSNITNQSLSEILESIKSKKISSLELTQAYIKNIENAKKLNAFVTTTFDQALENAKNFIIQLQIVRSKWVTYLFISSNTIDS